MTGSKITDRRSDAYGKTLALLRGKGQITVGIHGAEGSALHTGAEAGEGEGLTIAEIAERHEFGLGVPERSFIRAWFDERQGELTRIMRSQFELCLREGKPFEWGAERVALWMQADIQKRIRDRIAPALSPERIAEKGSDVPLIDTGVLRSAILAKFQGQAVGSPDAGAPAEARA